LREWTKCTIDTDLFNAFVLPNGPIFPAFAAVGDSALFDFGFGYQFNSWLRGDLTGEYRSEATYRRGISTAWWTGGGVGTNYDSYSAGLSTALFMANGYVDIGTWRGVTPHIHAGVGLASHNFQGLNDSAALWPWPPIRPISPGRSAPASCSASRRTSRSTSAIVTSTWAASGAIASNTASTSPASTSGIGSTSPRTTFA